MKGIGTTQNKVVLFSKSYLPLTRISVKRALILLASNRAVNLDYGGQTWVYRAPSCVFEIQEYIRLLTGDIERQWKVPKPSTQRIYRRDKFECQYCGATKGLTIDHVIPRSRGGQDTWTNLVTACSCCNSRKGSRLLSELSDMELKREPKPPVHPAIAFSQDLQNSWIDI